LSRTFVVLVVVIAVVGVGVVVVCMWFIYKVLSLTTRDVMQQQLLNYIR